MCPEGASRAIRAEAELRLSTLRDGVFHVWTRPDAPGNLGPSDTFDQENRAMGLFRRKQLTEEDDERCPNCRERVPEGAVACMMCGLALKPVRDASPDSEGKRPARSP